MATPRKRRIWLLTGEPGSGKSTALSKIVLAVKSSGYTVGGLLTREIRNRGEREGFRIVDVRTEESEILADVKGILGPRIGKYRVNLNSLSSFAAAALENAKDHSDLLVCDEVGPMELLSPEFRKAVRAFVLQTEKPSVCVVHKRYTDPLIEELRASGEAIEQEITFENRETVPNEAQKQIIQFLSSTQREKST
ncbi:MAG: NTPase [Nitrososphaerales archaeon]